MKPKQSIRHEETIAATDEIVERLNSEGERKEQICGMCGHFYGRTDDGEIIDGECRSDYPEVDKRTGFACHYKKVMYDNPACWHFRKRSGPMKSKEITEPVMTYDGVGGIIPKNRTFEEAIAADDAADRDARKTCVDAADWLDEPDERCDQIVDGFIDQGEVFAIVGQSKAGKSLLALQMAVCIALGIPFLGMACKRSRVYFGNCDVSEVQLKKRLRRICSALNVNTFDLRGWLFVDNLNDYTASLEDAIEICTDNDCRVAIIDSFYKIAGIVGTDESQCIDSIERMKSFPFYRITLGTVFNSPKGFSGDRQLIDMISGSSILESFIDSIIGLQNHATVKTARVVDSAIRNYKPKDPFTVLIENGVFKLAPGIPTDVSTRRKLLNRTKKISGSRSEPDPLFI